MGVKLYDGLSSTVARSLATSDPSVNVRLDGAAPPAAGQTFVADGAGAGTWGAPLAELPEILAAIAGADPPTVAGQAPLYDGVGITWGAAGGGGGGSARTTYVLAADSLHSTGLTPLVIYTTPNDSIPVSSKLLVTVAGTYQHSGNYGWLGLSPVSNGGGGLSGASWDGFIAIANNKGPSADPSGDASAGALGSGLGFARFRPGYGGVSAFWGSFYIETTSASSGQVSCQVSEDSGGGGYVRRLSTVTIEVLPS
jgi:hypothetical protein